MHPLSRRNYNSKSRTFAATWTACTACSNSGLGDRRKFVHLPPAFTRQVICAQHLAGRGACRHGVSTYSVVSADSRRYLIAAQFESLQMRAFFFSQSIAPHGANTCRRKVMVFRTVESDHTVCHCRTCQLQNVVTFILFAASAYLLAGTFNVKHAQYLEARPPLPLPSSIMPKFSRKKVRSLRPYFCSTASSASSTTSAITSESAAARALMITESAL